MAERIHVEELETSKPLTRELKVTVQEDALRHGLERVAKRVSREIRIPGFRPGRAPYPIVERYVGREYLIREFLSDELENLTAEALDEVNIKDTFSVELVDVNLQEPSFHMAVALPPRVVLGDYMSIRIPYEEPEVTDEDVDKVLRDVLRSRGEVEEIEGPIEEEDHVDLVLTIRVGEETLVEEEELTADMEAELYLPELTQHLLGARVGETREFTLPVPEDHAWREHGEEAHVTARILRVYRFQVPDLTLEMAQELNPDVESVEELKDIVRNNLKARRHQEAMRAYRAQILEKILAISTVEISPLMVDRELDAYVEELKRYAQSLGMQWEDYLRAVKLTEEKIREQHREEVEETLRQDLVLEAIANEHKIEITESAIAEVMAYYHNQGMSLEEVNRRLEGDAAFRQQVLREAFRISVLDFLAKVARGEMEAEAEEEATEEEATEEENQAGDDEQAPQTEAANQEDTEEEGRVHDA